MGPQNFTFHCEEDGVRPTSTARLMGSVAVVAKAMAGPDPDFLRSSALLAAFCDGLARQAGMGPTVDGWRQVIRSCINDGLDADERVVRESVPQNAYEGPAAIEFCLAICNRLTWSVFSLGTVPALRISEGESSQVVQLHSAAEVYRQQYGDIDVQQLLLYERCATQAGTRDMDPQDIRVVSFELHQAEWLVIGADPLVAHLSVEKHPTEVAAIGTEIGRLPARFGHERILNTWLAIQQQR